MSDDNTHINGIRHEREKHMTARNYARSTIKTYTYFIYDYFRWNGDQMKITESSVLSYMSHLYGIGRSTSTVNQAVNAIKYWMEQVCGQPRRLYNLKRPRK